jgi:hypothetical protein
MERQQEPLQYPHMGYCSNPRGKWQQGSLPTANYSSSWRLFLPKKILKKIHFFTLSWVAKSSPHTNYSIISSTDRSSTPLGSRKILYEVKKKDFYTGPVL